MPNVLRAVLGQAGGAGADRVVCLETNLDDLVPEHFDYLMERLFEAVHREVRAHVPGHVIELGSEFIEGADGGPKGWGGDWE